MSFNVSNRSECKLLNSTVLIIHMYNFGLHVNIHNDIIINPLASTPGQTHTGSPSTTVLDTL